MSRLPVLLSVPHTGLQVPRDVAQHCVLSPAEIFEDSDVGASDIFFPLQRHVAAVVTTTISRAIVDVDRDEDDRYSFDGVFKTRTRRGARIWREPPGDAITDQLRERFYHPYLARLEELAPKVALGVDCHTVSPNLLSSRERPHVSISGDCPNNWIDTLAGSLRRSLVSLPVLTEASRVGHISSSRPGGIHWIKLRFAGVKNGGWGQRRSAILRALQELCRSADIQT